MTKAERDLQAKEFQTSLSQMTSVLTDALSLLATKKTAYENEGGSEAELLAAYKAVVEKLAQNADQVLATINSLAAINKVTGEIVTAGLVYNEKENVFSQFIGNTNLGAYAEAGWQFNTSFAYLADVINSSVCEVQ